MKYYPTIKLLVLVLLIVCRLDGTAGANSDDVITQAREILDTTGTQGGIVVHLGCGNGKLTAALHVSDRYTIHGLEADPVRVAVARNHIQTKGIYGAVSVERHSGSTLPYTANLINLIVVQNAGTVAMNEMMRVLAPGVAV